MRPSVIAIVALFWVSPVFAQSVRIDSATAVSENGSIVNYHFAASIVDTDDKTVLDSWNQYVGDTYTDLIASGTLTVDEAQALWGQAYLKRYLAESQPQATTSAPVQVRQPSARTVTDAVSKLDAALRNARDDDARRRIQALKDAVE